MRLSKKSTDDEAFYDMSLWSSTFKKEIISGICLGLNAGGLPSKSEDRNRQFCS